MTDHLPDSIGRSVQDALRTQFGSGAGIDPGRVKRVSGGDIHQALQLGLQNGDRVFFKWSPAVPEGMFEAEAEGLEALRTAAPAELRVPAVVGHGRADLGGAAWLLLEWVSMSPAERDSGARFGRALASLHKAAQNGGWGWSMNNWIGRLAQDNTPAAGWAGFWRDRRLAPQLEQVSASGFLRDGQGRVFSRLLDRLEDALGDLGSEPSLLHGDLWGGNVGFDETGLPTLYDPAVYSGHAEVDLAMSELFGFPVDFRDAYHDVLPPDPAYRAYRRDLYQLYYRLVHVNLFGTSYLAGALSAAERVLAEVGS